ncbi:hypothetical protein MKX01_002462 [Papaver californicum]|nr:hypothetical protein MKX01_002462 [Papaver californicum]
MCHESTLAFFNFYHLAVVLCCFFSILFYLKLKNHFLQHWPIFGELPSVLQNLHRIHDWISDVLIASGSTKFVSGPVFWPLNILLTCDPRNVEYILKTNIANFPKGTVHKEAFDILGDSLLNSESDLWHAQRKMATKIFMTRNFRSIVAETSKKLVQDALLPLLAHFAKQPAVHLNLQDVLMRYTFDVSLVIIFGENLKYLDLSLPPNEFAQAVDNGAEAVFHRHLVPSGWWKLCRLLRIGSERKMYKAKKTINEHVAQCIMDKREDMIENKEASDILGMYMAFKEEKLENGLLVKDDKFLGDTTRSFLLAGRDAVGMSLTWFFWLVSKNPRVEAKILEEMHIVLRKRNTAEGQVGLKLKRPLLVFDIDELKEMVYLHAALCESLRLYPAVPLNGRTALKKDVFPDGTIIKPGMMVLVSVYAAGRAEMVWGKDCLEFNPERWLGEDGKLNRECMSKLYAFGIGQRSCMGQEMAFMMMKSAVSAMLFNFHVGVVEGQNIQPKSSIFLAMKNDLMVTVKERV